MAAAFKVAIRADASAAIGLGHLQRCLALAHALCGHGARVTFAMRRIDAATASACEALVAAQGFACLALGRGAVSDQAPDADAFVDLARAFAPDLVVVDHYGLDATWHRRVRAALGAPLAAIDDLADRELEVATLIDHNEAADHRRKYAACLPAASRLLGGPAYALLGPAYANAPRHVLQPAVRSIGIFMGGADAAGFSALAHAACRAAGFGGEVEIATTRANPHRAALQALAAADARTRVTLDQADLAGFFARHGLQVGAGGGATWERCCIGAPTLALCVADNQRQVLGPLQHLGVLREVPGDAPTVDDIAAAVRDLLEDAAERAALSAAARRLVDGHGAARAAQALLTP
jgi:UDP-2,4-diacetamido-2,4,6-trideoxy-beta-L-altropyranose hydrolase